MPRYSLTPQSRLVIRSRSSVHPIEWRARTLGGYLDMDEPGGDSEAVTTGRLEITVRDLTSGNKAYDLQLPRTVHARKYPLVVAQLDRLDARGSEYLATGTVTFHGSSAPASCLVRVETTGDTVELSGQATLDLRSFGFSPPRVLGLRVFPDVEVEFATTGVSPAGQHDEGARP